MACFLKCSATVPFAIGRIRRDGLAPENHMVGTSHVDAGDRRANARAPLFTQDDRSRLRGLSGFFLSAFFQRGFARKFHATFVVDTDALDPDDVANFGNVFGPFDAKIRELGNVH